MVEDNPPKNKNSEPFNTETSQHVEMSCVTKIRGRNKGFLVLVPGPCYEAATGKLRTMQAKLFVLFPERATAWHATKRSECIETVSRSKLEKHHVKTRQE